MIVCDKVMTFHCYSSCYHMVIVHDLYGSPDGHQYVGTQSGMCYEHNGVYINSATIII